MLQRLKLFNLGTISTVKLKEYRIVHILHSLVSLKSNSIRGALCLPYFFPRMCHKNVLFICPQVDH